MKTVLYGELLLAASWRKITDYDGLTVDELTEKAKRNGYKPYGETDKEIKFWKPYTAQQTQIRLTLHEVAN
jgi:hypothetical protein